MGCCNSQVIEEQYVDESDEVRAMIQDRESDVKDTITVGMKFKAEDLPQEATFVVIYEDKEGENTLVGRTETQYGTTAPTWKQGIEIDFQFEVVQNLTIKLYQEVKKIGFLHEQNLLDETTIQLTRLWNESPVVETLQKTKGKLTIISDEVKGSREEEAIIKLSASNLPSTNLKTLNPFVTISRVVDQQLIPILKSEHIMDTKTPSWAPLHVKVERLCKGEYNSLLVLEVFSWDISGKHQYIGCCRTSLGGMLSGGYEEYELHHDIKKLTIADYSNSGLLKVDSIEVEECHSFLDFVRGGFDINLSVAIDFTKSNRPFSSERSLHYHKGDNKTNDYMTAIEAVGQVLCYYDADQEFPMHGFGARLPSGEISHCFSCTLTDDEEVSGLDGIAEAYWNCLKEIVPVEPTNMAPIIRKSISRVQEKTATGELCYEVLLIITDGGISDMRQTMEAVMDASEHAISILIVGVGHDNFSKMRMLDNAADMMSRPGERRLKRDIVGFVPFQTYMNDPEALARECLKEIPLHFTTWARQNKIVLPNRRFDPSAVKKMPTRTRGVSTMSADNPDRLSPTHLKDIRTHNSKKQTFKSRLSEAFKFNRIEGSTETVNLPTPALNSALKKPLLNSAFTDVNPMSPVAVETPIDVANTVPIHANASRVRLASTGVSNLVSQPLTPPDDLL
eukprot:TRINITY_DN3928_c1_g3_i1.p1 TRINITY_DN3928_c1_g3~~TRINITY_DN3928_c1_g3_i1.p1  ORF type:complete len:722 (+),score=152.18 TRINITY_DN3928_c1_g3_i1:137-2167(+)